MDAHPDLALEELIFVLMACRTDIKFISYVIVGRFPVKYFCDDPNRKYVHGMILRKTDTKTLKVFIFDVLKHSMTT